MTAPVIHTATTGSDAANTTSTVAKLASANFSDGDTVYIGLVSDAGSNTFTAPARFSTMAGTPVNVSGGTATLVIFYQRNISKAAETLNGANYEFTVGVNTSERQSWICWAVTGDGNSFDGIDVAAVGNSSSAASNFLSTTKTDDLIVLVVGADASAGSPTPMTPAAMTKLAEITGSSAGSIGVFYEAAPTTGTWPSNGNVTLNVSEQWVAAVFAHTAAGQGVNVGDTVTLAETTVLIIATPAVSVSDTVALGEAITLAVASQPSVSDAIALGEAVSLTLVNTLSVSDAVALAETVTLDNARTVSVSDAISLTEAKTVLSVLLIAVTDGVTLTEAFSLNAPVQISVSDAVTLGEAKTVSIPGVTPTQVNISDAAVLAEAVSVATGAAPASVSDAISHTETVTLVVTSFVSKSESVSLAESVTVRPTISLNVADAISLTEAVAIGNARQISVADAIGLTEALATGGQLFVNTTTAIALAESKTIAAMPADRNLAVSDSLVTTDTVGGGALVHLFICLRKAKTTKFLRSRT